jgi:hypothetical protein
MTDYYTCSALGGKQFLRRALERRRTEELRRTEEFLILQENHIPSKVPNRISGNH